MLTKINFSIHHPMQNFMLIAMVEVPVQPNCSHKTYVPKTEK